MRQKIDFGIDLGTTNSAIACMQDGEAKVIKSDDNQMDTTPSRVAYNKKQTMFVGLSASSIFERDATSAFNNRKEIIPNSYQEFKRTMGTDFTYTSSHMNRSYTSEELSAEVLKKLKGYVLNEDVASAVITVPAMFKQSQLDATQRAAKLAGFKYCELLQEPIAASIAYGIKAGQTTGYWLVFDFGGGTFDAALMHVEDGIMKVVDTAGDNHLGGKDLDNAIVDKILIPELAKQCVLDDTLANNSTRKLLQDALKEKAEKTKIALSTRIHLKVEIEDLLDDNKEEIMADINISLEQYEKVSMPIFQRAIDITKDVLKRNHLSDNDLSSLILVGGPTFQQTLRRMLKEQITPNVDTSIDPMTAVAVGAALFASTKSIPLDLQKRDTSKAQLILKYPETTVETHENLGVRIDREKSTANLPNKFTIEIVRGDSAWSSGKVLIEGDAEVIELALNEGKANLFNLKLFSPDGATIPCEPSSITIIQGLKIANATLPYAVGLEVYSSLDNKQGVYHLEGLEKNKTLPAKGKGRFKTMKDIRPANAQDKFEIPIYEYQTEGSRAILNTFFGEISFTGADLPSLLPKDSDIEVTLNIDASRRGKVSIYIPLLDESFDKAIAETIEKDIKTAELRDEIRHARTIAQSLADDGHHDAQKSIKELDEIEQLLVARGQDRATKEKVRQQLQDILIGLDKQQAQGEWPKAQQDLQEAFSNLVEANTRYGNSRISSIVDEYERQTQQIITKQDTKSARKLGKELTSMSIELESQDISFWVGFVYYMDESFDEIEWTDRPAAYRGVQQLKQLLNINPNKDRLQAAVMDVVRLMSSKSLATMQNVNTELLRKG
jgi:molecular chaperone DnaK